MSGALGENPMHPADLGVSSRQNDSGEDGDGGERSAMNDTAETGARSAEIRYVGQRSVLFDTETTGLDPLNGDRVIEVAALELLNDLPTGKHFHALIDPQRAIPPEASRIHGFTNADLAGKPLFAEIAQSLADFFGDSHLIAHNAPFDFG